MNDLQRLTAMVLRFRAQRRWKQFHTPKELAVSLVVEAAELLEIFQWKKGRELKETVRRRRDDIADELADCLHSILLLAHDLDLDLEAAFTAKLKKAAAKYPVSRSKGSPRKYNELT